MRTVSQPCGWFSVGGLSSKRNSHPLIQHVCVPAPSLRGRYPLLRCRVGGGALTRWPPSAAQTARTVFPYAAFTKTPPTETQTKGNYRVDPLRARQVDPGHQYPQTMMYGFFATRTDPPHRLYSSGFPSRPSCPRPPPSPTHSGRRSLGRAVLAALQVLHSGPSTDRASLATSLPLIGLLTPVPPGDSVSPPEVTRCSSVPCHPQTPWCGG